MKILREIVDSFKARPAEPEIIKLGQAGDELEVRVRISAKAKSIKLRITPKNNIELVLPNRASPNQIKQAYQFLQEKESWLKAKLAHITINPAKFSPKIPIFGEEHIVVLNQSISKKIRISHEQGQLTILARIDESKINSIISDYLKQLLQVEINNYAEKISQILQVKYNQIKLRDTYSRWGSCSSSGNLSFSWRLVFAPRFVMEYVVVHELCHLLEMNHSDRFWKLVEQTCPQYSKAKIWIKQNGYNLHKLLV